MKEKLINKNNRGVILIEAILALGVIIIIMTALVTALISSVNSSNYSKDQSKAADYAQEALELARNEKDFNFAEFSNLASTTGQSYCFPVGTNTFSIYAGSEAECNDASQPYTRTLFISSSDTDKCSSTNSIYVQSTVSWTDSRCTSGDECHKVQLDSCFVNLNGL